MDERRPIGWPRRRAGGFALGLALALAFGGVPGLPLVGGPAPARAADPVPACAAGSRLTPIRSFDRVADTLVDTTWRVGRSYAPPDLVSSARAGVNGGHRIREVIVADLAAMRRAAARSGVSIRIVSAYRSYATQARLLETYIRLIGREKALRRVARPGHSEHQLGVAIDVAGRAGAYAWAARQSWRFGFIVSYPAGATRTSCYQHEPWHLRWVGRARARLVHASGLTYRAWLWRNVPESHE